MRKLMRKLKELELKSNSLAVRCENLNQENMRLREKILELQIQSDDKVENAFEIVFGNIDVGNVEFGDDSILTSARLVLRGDFRSVSNFIKNLLKSKTR